MTEKATRRAWDARAFAGPALQASAIVWFVPAMTGQWLFAYHVAVDFIGTALSGNAGSWNQRLFVGLIEGDMVGNAALAAHLFFAFVINIGGTLQLVPQLRARAPTFHRWNGRLYIATALIMSITALYMVWTRETFGGVLINDISQTLNGALIIVFAAMALCHAIARRIDAHLRWALRTFMAVSGVWCMRVIYAFLDAIPGDTPWTADDMTGPANIAINFASYLLPLALLELYFFAKRRHGAILKLSVAALVLATAAATSIGVYGTAGRWLGG